MSTTRGFPKVTLLSGGIPVHLLNGGAGGTASNDEDAFTAGVSAGTPMMGVVNPVDTPSDGTLAVPALDNQRRLKVVASVSVAAIASNVSSDPVLLTVGTSASTILAANGSRKKVKIQNVGTTKVYIVFGTFTPTVTAYSEGLAACGSAHDGSSKTVEDTMWTGAVKAISSAAGGLVQVTEWT